MSEKISEPLMSDNVQSQQYNGPPPPPGYPGQQNYVPPPQPGYVVQGQPVQQGYVVQPPPYGVQYSNGQLGVGTVVQVPQHEDHMIAAILVTLFCFFPTGILAIMRASDAKAAASYGDLQSAERHSKSAKKMIKISIIAGIVCTLVMVAIVVIYVIVLANAAKKYHHEYSY